MQVLEKRESFHVQGNMDIRLFSHVVSVIEFINDGELCYEEHTVSGIQRKLFENISKSFITKVPFPKSAEEALKYLQSRHFQGRQVALVSKEARDRIGKHFSSDAFRETKNEKLATLDAIGKLYPEDVKQAEEFSKKEKDNLNEMERELSKEGR